VTGHVRIEIRHLQASAHSNPEHTYYFQCTEKYSRQGTAKAGLLGFSPSPNCFLNSANRTRYRMLQSGRTMCTKPPRSLQFHYLVTSGVLKCFRPPVWEADFPSTQ
jgi:hypothetical protein